MLDQLKVPGRKDPKADIFKLFGGWLRDARKEIWLLILDNANDSRFLLEPPTMSEETEIESQRSPVKERCLDYVPACNHGTVLLTTRSTDAALNIVEDDKSIVCVNPMNKEEAIALIQRKLGGQHSQEDVIRLASALDFMLLAIVQAGAYIKQRAPRCSVEQYVEKLQKSDKSKLSLLNYNARGLRRDREASNSIVLTWQISFEYIHNARPSTADLLSLMSFFDRQAIPEALLRGRGISPGVEKTATRGKRDQEHDVVKFGSKEDSDSDSSDDAEDNRLNIEADDFEKDVVMLRNYSFVSITTHVETFEMHGLVQLATQTWLAANMRLERWKSQFIINLDDAFPAGEYENWAKCQILYPHAKVALDLKPKRC